MLVLFFYSSLVAFPFPQMSVGTTIAIKFSLKWGPFFQESVMGANKTVKLSQTDEHTQRKNNKYNK